MTVPAATKERAYQVWLECGQNLSECFRKMNGSEGYIISKKALHEWKTKYNWEKRAAQFAIELVTMSDATSDDAILTPLIEQKVKYEVYFKSLAVDEVDNQAVYGYNAILKTILEIRQKVEEREREGVIDGKGVGFIIKTAGDAVNALEMAVSNKLNAMLAHQGSVSLKSVKEMEKALVLIDKMRAKYIKDSKGKSKRSGLTEKATLDIQKKILGMDES